MTNSTSTSAPVEDKVAGGEPTRLAGLVAGALLAAFSFIAVRSHGLINSDQASLAAQVATPVVVGLVPVAGAEILRRFVRPVEKRLDVSDRNRAKVEAWLAEQGLVPVSAALIGSTSAAVPALVTAASGAASAVLTPPSPTLSFEPDQQLVATIQQHLTDAAAAAVKTAVPEDVGTPIGDAAEVASTTTTTTQLPGTPLAG